MEDADFSEKMRRFGKIVLLPEVVETSVKKYAAESKLQSIYRTIWAYTAFQLGVDPEKIRQGYYGLAKKESL